MEFLSLVAGVVVGFAAGWLLRGLRPGTAASAESPAAATAATESAAAFPSAVDEPGRAVEPVAPAEREPVGGAVAASADSKPVAGDHEAADEPTAASTEPEPAAAPEQAATETVAASEHDAEPKHAAATVDLGPAGTDTAATDVEPVPAEAATAEEERQPKHAAVETDRQGEAAEPVAEQPVRRFEPEPIAVAAEPTVVSPPAAEPTPVTAAKPAPKPRATRTRAAKPAVVAEPVVAEPVVAELVVAAVPGVAEADEVTAEPAPVAVAPAGHAGVPDTTAAVPGVAGADEVAAVPAPVAVAVVEPDDLTKIPGIGPKMAMALAASGITTFGKLADTDVPTLRAAVTAAGLRLAPTLPRWPEHARQLAGTPGD
ncbi:helix-hairpin-helix domain-containing protein [Actinoplanes sp. URMC 104]|uniref:helix-hairpin-helix domain-containing protein n=1 Tax=Actinoplanes sp. URMC 104 TaxID=3423409 RepID=UPI003F1ADE18